MKYVILKVDTTGLDPDIADIVRITAIRVKDNDKQIFDKFVNPRRHIPEEASKISGIYDNDVSRAPFFENIKEQFLEFIGDFPLIGHNVSFDISFINKYLDTPLANKSMSLMSMARFFGYDGSFKFLAMCKHYKVPYYMHYNTAEITDMLFKAMIEEYKNKKDN